MFQPYGSINGQNDMDRYVATANLKVLDMNQS